MASDDDVELVAAEITTRGRIVGILIRLLQEASGDDYEKVALEANYLASKIAGQKTSQAIGKNDMNTIRNF